MARLKRFEEYRFVGAKDTMVVYDTDDPDQLAELQRRVEEDRLYERNLLLGFAPDTLAEAENRGFRRKARASRVQPEGATALGD